MFPILQKDSRKVRMRLYTWDILYNKLFFFFNCFKYNSSAVLPLFYFTASAFSFSSQPSLQKSRPQFVAFRLDYLQRILEVSLVVKMIRDYRMKVLVEYLIKLRRNFTCPAE